MRSPSFLAGGLLGGSLLVLGLGLAACSGDDSSSSPVDTDGGARDTGASPDGTSENDGGGTPDGDSGTPICSATPCVVQIAAGGIHSCALVDDGSVRCWGSNQTGELGMAPGTDRHSKPVPVSGVTAAEIAAGGEDDTTGYTCARLANGTVSCWGSDNRHQLGRTRGADTVFPTPAPVEGVTGASAISTGFSHACAVLTGGGVMCWGNNGDGELGREPTDVDGLMAGSVAGLPVQATRPQAAGEHTCVLLNDGTVACFGLNGESQLGSADAGDNSVLPIRIPGVAGVTELVSHGYHACALQGTTGTVMCWGNNESGKLGVGDDARHGAPVQVHLPAGHKALHIGGGDVATCAAMDDQTLYCWGSNDMGQVGIPTSSDPGGSFASTPVKVNGLPAEPVIQITGGYEHTCALVQSGSVYCWGSNYLGELGRADSVGDTGIDYSPHYAPAKVVF
jgi:alpha-tubulin suppressor-like RCC1 family protein